MNYLKIKKNDIANGDGVRVSIFLSGCEFYCKGCFNKEAWDFASGQEFDESAYQEIANELDKEYINGITFLGGEPLHPKNVEGVSKLIKRIREEYPDKNIWVYSGFQYEHLIERSDAEKDLKYILENIDVLVDGLFVQELHDPSLEFRGSANQRIFRFK